MAETTPMLKQYRRIKAEHGDAVLFFRLGDFYEMFDRDAVMVSSLLNLTLTHRNGLPMCGIPYHAVHTYIPRLLRKGKKIAVCEQTSLPEKGKKIVDREVVEIITPGTVTEEEYLERNKNNFIVSLGVSGATVSLSAIDLATAEFSVRSFSLENSAQRVREELMRLDPSEVLIQESLLEEEKGLASFFSSAAGITINRYPDWYFDEKSSYRRVVGLLAVQNLKGYGFDENSPELASCAVLIDYLENNAKHLLTHITGMQRIEENSYMGIDEATQKNLELIKNLSDREERFTLLEVLDRTKTPMGGRMIRQRILSPLRDIDKIEKVQDQIEEIYKEQLLLSELRKTLSSIRDIERLASRIALDKAHGKDLLAVKQSLATFFDIHELLSGGELSQIEGMQSAELSSRLEELKELFAKALHEDPPVLISEGRLIRDGFDADLDALRKMKSDSKRILDAYLKEEKEESGIGNLRINYNKIIGYFLEVSKGQSAKVPSHFIRKQSLVGSERYSTERLNQLEEDLNNASERIVDLEKRLFFAVRNKAKEYLYELKTAARVIAAIDTMQSLAYCATLYGWRRPRVHEGRSIEISEGRHPVVETHGEAGSFVPNSISLDSNDRSFALITGPNMSGKSTYLRQVALIVLLAQMGSFVPADEANIGIVDRIFCRVGASDNLARGESTFLVEMNETAYILNTAAEQSLVIMDEVGRGTSTSDGLSIAWAVSEYLLKIRAKTLFATHYHELTAMENTSIQKLHLQVSEENGEIIFLKRVKEGSAGRSYGIHVAKLAGLPETVLLRAEELLRKLEERERRITNSERGEEDLSFTKESGQTELFSSGDLIAEELAQIDVNRVTPMDALLIIERWKKERDK
jgi:DNA mismatch repair protein MutS